MPTTTEDIATSDIAYLSHGARALMLRLFTPAGAGPFPLVIDLHPGAWTSSDRSACYPRDEALARAGIAAAAVDFRHAADGYPSSLVDVNYAVRWLKARAPDLRLDPGRVALCGQSSGGHLAMLAAMRPADPRYASVPLAAGAPPVDAAVRCVALLWPVINPLSRYRNALRARASANPPGWVGDLPENHDTYWKTEAAMAEGNPTLALERGEAVATPPAVWIQGRPDPVHDYRDPDSALALNEPERFAARYRKAGGAIEIVRVEQAARSQADTFAPLARFFARHLV